VKAGAINGKRRRRGIPPPPLAFLSLLLFKLALELLHSPLHPQHTNTRTRAPIPPAPPPLHHHAAGRRRWSTPWTYPFLPRTRSYPSRDACCPGEAVIEIVQRLELGSPPAGASPDPPPSPSFLTRRLPFVLSSPPSSTHGEQKPLLDIPFSCAFWCLHELVGAAAPPPSGAGRRRGTIAPLDPSVTCACAPSTFCASLWSC
jgi:hypothetical protein